MARVHYPTKLEAERRFNHRVDILVPPGGLGGKLNEMLEWSRVTFPADQWAQHGHSVWVVGKVPEDYARFYFLTADDADLFRWRWVLTEPDR